MLAARLWWLFPMQILVCLSGLSVDYGGKGFCLVLVWLGYLGMYLNHLALFLLLWTECRDWWIWCASGTSSYAVFCITKGSSTYLLYSLGGFSSVLMALNSSLCDPSLNRNIGKYHLPHIWDEVLFNMPELKEENLYNHSDHSICLIFGIPSAIPFK